MKDYSQNGEQSHILKYFGGKIGTLLDCGANDGIVLSNSRALVELGWDAVLVEPSEAAYRKLIKNNANKIFTDKIRCVAAAITREDGEFDFYDSGSHLGVGDTSLLSTTKESELARWKKSGETFTKTTVRGITIKTLMEETGVNKFDFISIDCEGVDYEVLTQINLTETGTSLVCVEYNGKEPEKYLAYCAKHGLNKLIHKNFENLIIGK